LRVASRRATGKYRETVGAFGKIKFYTDSILSCIKLLSFALNSSPFSQPVYRGAFNRETEVQTPHHPLFFLFAQVRCMALKFVLLLFIRA
jgi:hypothetical protein